MELRSFLLVCCGGALGSGCRYVVTVALTVWLGPSFPFGTLAVNLLGSFLLGAIMALATEGRISPEARLALGTGVMGGFTTYSTFSWETFALAEAGSWPTAALYAGLTFAACLVGTGLGVAAARAVSS